MTAIQEIMKELEEAGWRKAKEKSADQVTDIDIKSVFNLVDIDKSGTVSRTVSLIRKNVEAQTELFLGSQDGR